MGEPLLSRQIPSLPGYGKPGAMAASRQECQECGGIREAEVDDPVPLNLKKRFEFPPEPFNGLEDILLPGPTHQILEGLFVQDVNGFDTRLLFEDFPARQGGEDVDPGLREKGLQAVNDGNHLHGVTEPHDLYQQNVQKSSNLSGSIP